MKFFFIRDCIFNVKDLDDFLLRSRERIDDHFLTSLSRKTQLYDKYLWILANHLEHKICVEEPDYAIRPLSPFDIPRVYGHVSYIMVDCYVEFTNESDAVLYKLRW